MRTPACWARLVTLGVALVPAAVLGYGEPDPVDPGDQQQVFWSKNHDTNDDGVMDLQELRAFCNVNEWWFPEFKGNITEIAEAMDADADGRVLVDEMNDFMKAKFFAKWEDDKQKPRKEWTEPGICDEGSSPEGPYCEGAP